MTPREAIKKEYGETSKNIITPRVLGYGRISETLVYELSTGNGIPSSRYSGLGPQIWGVSVVEIGSDESGAVTTKRRHDLSECLHSRDAVCAHIKKIKRDEREGKR
jgi:hypothetical protein